MTDIPKLPRFVSKDDFITWGPGRCGYCGVQFRSDNDPRYIAHTTKCKSDFEQKMADFRAARERLRNPPARVEPERLTLNQIRERLKKINKR